MSLTQFGRMCQKLGTKILGANSPQAKGRVERNHGTQQDRLIKKLRLQRIDTLPAANQYLEQHYLPDHNRRFRQEAAEPQDYHWRAPGKRELETIFRREEERTISNDWVVRYQGRFLQIERESRYAQAGGTVLVSEGRDGRLQVLYRGREVKLREMPALAPRAKPEPLADPRAIEIRNRSIGPPATTSGRSLGGGGLRG